MNHRAFGLVGGALLLVVGASANASAEACEEPRTTTFIFGNGMFNTPKEAEASGDALEAIVSTRASLEMAEGEHWSFEVAYNENESPLRQIFQVASQRLSADRSHFWRMLSGLEIAPDWFREAMLTVATGIELAPFDGDPDLARHLARYRELVQSGSKVVVVAHSQGNLYANAAYLSLFDRGVPLDPAAFGIVSVATPADYVAGVGIGMPYTTLEEDMIIAAVRAVSGNTLPANVTTGDVEVEDPIGHGFTRSYLQVPSVRDQILDHVFVVEAQLPQPDVPESSDPPARSAHCRDGGEIVNRGTGEHAVGETEECAPELWTDTCFGTYLEACWDGEGGCAGQTVFDGSSLVSTFEWANGARVSIASYFPDLNHIGQSPSSTVIVSSTGRECARGQIFTTQDPSCIAGASYTSAAGPLSYCVDGNAFVRGTCPDGTTFARSAVSSCTPGPNISLCGF